jgi:hypothetical protein
MGELSNPHSFLALATERIHIILEVLAECGSPVVLSSIGKEQRGNAARRDEGVLPLAHTDLMKTRPTP